MITNVEIGASVYRGDEIEAIHYASIAVVNEKGKLTHYLGDPGFVCMTRSCIKPFQLMPLLATGAADDFGFDERQLAIMCGSHNGTDEHRDLVIANLKRSNHLPGHLLCGTHWPLQMEANREYPQNGEDSDPVRHNCSGKHSGFLALAKKLGDKPENYLDSKSNTQKLVLKTVSQFCEFPLDRMLIGIDGCSAPNFPLALDKLAYGFVKLITEQGDTPLQKAELKRIKFAMFTYPMMISGEGRFDLALSQALPGKVICKVGAEGIEGIALSDPPVGIAVKIHDGNMRALWPVCIEVLRQLGYIPEDEDIPSGIASFANGQIRNVRGILTGRVIPEFKLRKV